MKSITFFLSLLLTASAFAQNGLNFDGVNDKIQTTYPGVLGTANRTFEAWVYLSVAPTGNNCILDYGLNAVGSRNTFSVTSSGQIGFTSGGTNANISSSAGAVTVGQWVHVAFVLNNGTGYLYANGVQVGTGSLSTVNTPSGNVNLSIGERIAGGSIPFRGTIDEVRIWNVARTQAEIVAGMNNEYCSVPTGLEAYYKFNQGVAGGTNASVTTATDALGTNNGTLTGFALTGATSNWVVGKSLTSGSNTPGNASITACDSYTANTGAVWTTSGNYVDTISGSTGCDSILNIALTINQSSTGNLTASGCNKYTSPSGNNTWTTSGTYNDILTNSVGCDSVLTINLTIATVDTQVFQNGIVLSAWATGATYQWLNCGTGFSAVAGATSQTFTPTANGSYAVQVNKNGCIDTSACYTVTGVGMEENQANFFALYPNPTNGVLIIKPTQTLSAGSLRILNVTGSVVYETVIEGSQDVTLNVNLAKGLYLVQLINNKGVQTVPVVFN